MNYIIDHLRLEDSVIEKRERRKLIVALLIALFALGALGRSSSVFSIIRTVDALLLFVAGVAAGIALSTFRMNRSE